MGYDAVRKFLKDFGLTEKEAEVYVFLAKRGALRSGEIVKGLKTHKGEVYRVLKSLQTKGLVEVTLEFPKRFTAVPFEAALDSFIKIKREEVTSVENARQELLNDWKSISKTGVELPLEKFVVIEGNRRIYPKIIQMVQETRKHLSAVSTVAGLLRADQFGLFETILENPLKSKIKFRFLTDLSRQNLNAAKALLKKVPLNEFDFKGRNPELGLRLSPRMVIRDGEEILFFISSKDASKSPQNDMCLWTNCKSLVRTFLTMFEDLWRNATDIKKKIVEIETNKPAPKTCVIADSEEAKTRYEETLVKAAEDILIMTSSAGLIDFWRNKKLLTDCVKRGVSVRIMAPITGKNIAAAQDLLKSCKVKHVAVGYLDTTAIDGKHLFQFKNPPPAQINIENASSYENTFYTNDTEYVKKAKNMLEDIWKKAHAPSEVTIESIIKQTAAKGAPPEVRKLDFKKAFSKFKPGSVTLDDEASKTLTEEQVVHRAVSAEKILAKDHFKEFSRMFCTWSWAVIDSPKIFNLPKMIICAIHIEKQSSFGEEDTIVVSLWLKTPTGYGYLPVAILNDRPDTAAAIWKKTYVGTPAEHNVQTVKKDEIHVRVHGNTLFAGWTKPIQLWPNSYVLPPACLLFEGYGRAKPGRGTMISPAGLRHEMEYNGVESFVTLMHPAAKYEGSGIEGIVLRDCIIDIYPR